MRNIKLELCRIYMSVIICLHHFRLCSDKLPFGAGYLATDCFFFISGFFLSKYIEKEEAFSPAGYIKNRYLRMFPGFLLAFIITSVVRYITNPSFFSHNILYPLKELMMVELFSPPIQSRVNPPDWYVGYLLIASLLLYILLQTIPVLRKGWVLLILGLGGMLALCLIYGHLNIYPQYGSAIDVAVVRALSGMLIGGSIYYIRSSKTLGVSNSLDEAKELDKVKALDEAKALGELKAFDEANVLGEVKVPDEVKELDEAKALNESTGLGDALTSNSVKVMLNIILTIVGFVGSLYFLIVYNGYTYLDIVGVVLLLSLFVGVSNSDILKIEFPEAIQKAVIYMGKISFTMFLNHYWIALIFNQTKLVEAFDWKLQSIIFLGVVVIVSMVIDKLEQKLTYVIKRTPAER